MRAALKRYLKALGPGLITGAADDDPSGITTYSVVGASFGFDLLWTAAASTPLMIGVQLICARIGLVTGQGVIGAARAFCPRWVLLGACGLLLIANGLNIGADLAGMAEVTEMLTGLPHEVLIPAYGLAILVTMLFTSYGRFARWLKWLTLTLFAYVFAALLAHPQWRTVLSAAVLPRIRWQGSYWTALVGTLGTTISPYLFFWQASQEVEELQTSRQPPRRAAPPSDGLLLDARTDVVTGMLFSNVAMFFIIVATGATLYPAGMRTVETARQAAEALRPLAGDGAYFLYALGIIGTGLLAIPVLAGSASYAVAELFQWRSSLDLRCGARSTSTCCWPAASWSASDSTSGASTPCRCSTGPRSSTAFWPLRCWSS